MFSVQWFQLCELSYDDVESIKMKDGRPVYDADDFQELDATVGQVLTKIMWQKSRGQTSLTGGAGFSCDCNLIYGRRTKQFNPHQKKVREQKRIGSNESSHQSVEAV